MERVHSDEDEESELGFEDVVLGADEDGAYGASL